MSSGGSIVRLSVFQFFVSANQLLLPQIGIRRWHDTKVIQFTDPLIVVVIVDTTFVA